MQIQYIFELFGTLVFAISGALAADDKSNKDLFGITFIGFVTAIGGGTLRDVLLNSYPMVWIDDVHFIYAVLIGIIIVHLFFKMLQKLRKTIFLFDTLGLALFTIVGTEKAISLGVEPIISAIMGMFTAVMGGVIRDTLTNATPIIFMKEVYATACILGATLYLVLSYFEINRTPNFLISGAFIVFVRMIAVKYNLSLPSINQQN